VENITEALRATVQTRYSSGRTGVPLPARGRAEEGSVRHAQRASTGLGAVFYDGDTVIGGGDDHT
jgi:tRNA U34 2-thiouridine synthase MnmA/TrmU